jgi:hypothetical protein
VNQQRDFSGETVDILKQEKKLLKKIRRDEPPVIIPVNLDNIGEMSYKHDPHSTGEARLNLVIEEYLLDEVAQADMKSPLNIEIHFVETKDGDREMAERIIRNNFSRLVKNSLVAKRKEMKHWRFNFIIGLFFLAVCIFFSQVFKIFPNDGINQIMEESFSIIGWVALWEPASYFLYGWREGSETITSSIRLKNAEVSIVK